MKRVLKQILRIASFSWAWGPVWRQVMGSDVAIRAEIIGVCLTALLSTGGYIFVRYCMGEGGGSPGTVHASPTDVPRVPVQSAPSRPTTIEYSKPSGTRGTQTIYSVKCVDGPADGRQHPLLVDPAEMLQVGAPFVWVYDAQDHFYLPELDEATVKRLREEPGRAQRGSTVYASEVSHESKMEATGRNRYSLEQTRDGDFLLRYAGIPAPPPLTFPPKVEEPTNVLKLETSQGNVTTQRAYPLKCVGGTERRQVLSVADRPPSAFGNRAEHCLG
jgi:hypothetical protein